MEPEPRRILVFKCGFDNLPITLELAGTNDWRADILIPMNNAHPPPLVALALKQQRPAILAVGAYTIMIGTAGAVDALIEKSGGDVFPSIVAIGLDTPNTIDFTLVLVLPLAFHDLYPTSLSFSDQELLLVIKNY